ncbi:hypothetical protein U9M48_016596 [Paspalum notatum var. saurae]|uniref:Protein LURP-one-related 11 n=1 Tax=Paspalum notatum var. saurae TaxID=547442 RepID=A0AAQ3T7R8_PASNO
MAKIQPLPSPSPSPTPSSAEERQRSQVYTVWMKSLVFHGNGCTVYGADGRVAFRVDNYGCRGGREVFFMDRAGKALIRIQRKSFGVFKRWEARRCLDIDDDGGEEAARPWFTVHKARKEGGAAVTMHGSGGRTYSVDGCGSGGKSGYKVRGADGATVAAIARKQTASGVVLGDDVLTLTVGSGADHLFVLGLVIVCGLMNRRM